MIRSTLAHTNGWSSFGAGGTSTSAPLMAGLIADIDQGRLLSGLAPLSGAGGAAVGNPTLNTAINPNNLPAALDIHTLMYDCLSYANNDFTDITSGPAISPVPIGSTINYNPQIGYDIGSGLGAPGPNFVTSLATISPPYVTANPSSTAVGSGAAYSITCTAVGNPALSGVLQVSTDGGNTWSNVATTTSVSGNALTLSMTATAQANMDGWLYRGSFTNLYGSATTTLATLNILSPPAVTQNPSSQIVAVGGAATFTAAASGVLAPTVQWQLSTNGGTAFNNISGATSASYSFTVTSGQGGYQYQAVFTNASGSATSTAATLTLATAPTASRPGNVSVNTGSTATFTTTIAGIPTPTVQWQVSTNGGGSYSNISGATSASYSFTAYLAQTNYRYRAVVTNIAGSVTTNYGKLTVNNPQSATAPAVTTNPSNSTVNAGATASFTAAASGSTPLTVQWQVSTDGGNTFSNLGGATSATYSFTTARRKTDTIIEPYLRTSPALPTLRPPRSR